MGAGGAGMVTVVPLEDGQMVPGEAVADIRDDLGRVAAGRFHQFEQVGKEAVRQAAAGDGAEDVAFAGGFKDFVKMVGQEVFFHFTAVLESLGVFPLALPDTAFGGGFQPLGDGFFGAVDDDAALEAFKGHAGKALGVQLGEGGLVAVPVDRADERFAHAAAGDGVELSFGSLYFFNDFFIEVGEPGRLPQGGQGFLSGEPDGGSLGAGDEVRAVFFADVPDFVAVAAAHEEFGEVVQGIAALVFVDFVGY